MVHAKKSHRRDPWQTESWAEPPFALPTAHAIPVRALSDPRSQREELEQQGVVE